jgi:ATP-dependent DNA helicase Rep
MSAGLNLAQQEAVNYMHGPCLVLAGAGSGKTRVITHKIGRLIQTRGWRRSALRPSPSPTRPPPKCASAPKADRPRAKEVLICTFHALGVRMMREDGAVLGLKPQFSILDSDDVTSILKDAAAAPTRPRRASGSGPSACGRTWA